MEKKKRKIHQKNKELTFKSIFLRCLAFTALFCLIGFLIVLASSYFLYNTKDPTSYTQIAGISSLFVSVFLVGFIQSKINKQYYFLSSLILGTLIFILTSIIGLISSNNGFNTINFIWKMLIPVFCVLGGMLGITRENRKRKHHR